MVSEHLRPYVFQRTMDLSTPDDEHAPCCGACASIGAPVAESAESDTTTFFRYGPHETLAVRARSGATSEDFRVTKAVVVVGRAAARADLVIRDAVISRVQCRFVFAHGVVEIEDLGSACGTIVNGEMITRTTLREGDIVRVGNSELEVVRV